MAKAKTEDPKPAADPEPTKGEGEGAADNPAGEATPDASAAAKGEQPAVLGTTVRYNQLRNGPKIEPCVAIITGLHSASCVDLFVMARGHTGSANASVEQGAGAGCWEHLP